jgi:hypothetical protein
MALPRAGIGVVRTSFSAMMRTGRSTCWRGHRRVPGAWRTSADECSIYPRFRFCAKRDCSHCASASVNLPSAVASRQETTSAGRSGGQIYFALGCQILSNYERAVPQQLRRHVAALRTVNSLPACFGCLTAKVAIQGVQSGRRCSSSIAHCFGPESH